MLNKEPINFVVMDTDRTNSLLIMLESPSILFDPNTVAKATKKMKKLISKIELETHQLFEMPISGPAFFA
jgi:hypothetical protein